MDLRSLENNWNLLGESDPLWAVLMNPDRQGNRWDTREFFLTGYHDVVYAMHQIVWQGLSVERGRALDFGCAVGRLSQGLACYFDEVDGVDIAPAMIRQAREYNPYGDRVRFHHNPHSDLSLFADNQFDFVFSLIVLQHMEPRYAKRYIAEFLRVVKPGGLVLFQQPSHYSARPIDDTYLTRGDRFWQWMTDKTGWPKRVEPVVPSDMSPALPRYERLEPRLKTSGSQTRVDGAHAKSSSSVAGPPGLPPPAEFHTIARHKMIGYLKRLGGHVLAVTHRVEATPHHPSYRYFVTK